MGQLMLFFYWDCKLKYQEYRTTAGEIGGSLEAEASKWYKEHGTKPVVGFIAGQTAPKGRKMGHAGAIVGGEDDTAAAKMRIMGECGIHVVVSPADIGKTMAEVMAKKV